MRQSAQLGHFILLSLFTESKTTKNTPAVPDNAPTFSIYDSSGVAILEDKTLPKWGFGTTAQYGMDLMLNSTFSAGDYCAHMKWTEGGTYNARIMPFTVQPGSPSAKGVYHSLFYYDRPHAKFLVGATEDGTLEYRRNPYIA